MRFLPKSDNVRAATRIPEGQLWDNGDKALSSSREWLRSCLESSWSLAVSTSVFPGTEKFQSRAHPPLESNYPSKSGKSQMALLDFLEELLQRRYPGNRNHRGHSEWRQLERRDQNPLLG